MTSPTVTVAILSQAEPQAIFFQREREGDSEAHSPGRASHKWGFCLKGNEWQKEKGRWMMEIDEQKV